MAFIPVPDTVQANLRYLQDNQQLENTLYFHNEAGWDVAGMEQLGSDLWDWWEAELAPRVVTTVSLREVYLVDLSSDSAPTFTFVGAGGPVEGTNITTAMPNNVSIAISFRTAGRGRSFRGRNYYVGLGDNQVTDNTIGTAAIGDIVAAYEELLSSEVISVGEWVVVSRFHNHVPRITGVATPVIAVTVADKTIDSQRKRLPSRGR